MSNAKTGISDALAEAFQDAAQALTGNSDELVLGCKTDPVIDTKFQGSIQNMVSPSIDEDTGEVLGCWVRAWVYVEAGDVDDNDKPHITAEIYGEEQETADGEATH